MKQPIRALLILFYVGCICLVFMMLSPEEVTLFQDFTLKVPTLASLERYAPEPEPDLAFMDSLNQQADSLARLAEEEMEGDSLALAQADSIAKIPKEIKYEPAKPVRQEIEFPKDNPQALNHFFTGLQQLLGSGKLLRVMHYGDSQIEGDRISRSLRNRMQNRFGGCGVGLVPIRTRKNIRSTVETDFSDNWVKYAYMDGKRPKSNQLGLLASKFMFSKKPENEEMQHAWVRFKDTKMNYQRNSRIEQVSLLYRTQKRPMALELSLDGDSTILKKDLPPTAERLGIENVALSAQYEKVSLFFGSKGQPEVFAVGLDCKEGIAWDNIPIRGSSGVEFTKMNRDFLKAQIQQLGVKLIVVQFGVNVVPTVLDSYGFYERQFYRQLNYLKSISPDIDILVVSLSDMARKNESGRYTSYPNVVKIRDAQKRAAFKAGCAFWDLYEAMGGENAMASWVNSKPALATPDYIHFNGRGARVVAEMLYNALMQKYEQFKKGELEAAP